MDVFLITLKKVNFCILPSLMNKGVEGLNYRHGQSARGTSRGGGSHRKDMQLQIMERSIREIFLFIWRNWNLTTKLSEVFPKAYKIMMEKWTKANKANV